MNARSGSGWQTVLADLSLILFMITASAASQPPAPPQVRPAPILPAPILPAPILPAPILPALGAPVAVWRAEPGGTSLTAWLAIAGRDARLRLTIVAPPGASAAAAELAAQAGRPARIILEPGGEPAPFAALTYDQPRMAQGLQFVPAKEPLQ